MVYSRLAIINFRFFSLNEALDYLSSRDSKHVI